MEGTKPLIARKPGSNQEQRLVEKCSGKTFYLLEHGESGSRSLIVTSTYRQGPPFL